MKLENAFKHRSIWLGFAMIAIVLYHSQFWSDSSLYSFFKQYGYAGVDICLFASGIGCYYSLEKDPDVLAFLLRRLRKLAPAYFCVMVVWVLWRAALDPMPISGIVSCFLGLATYVSWDYHLNWYIGGLVLFYFLMPYFKRITDSFRTIWGDILAVAVLVMLAISFWNQNMIIYSRLPVCYLGVVCGKLAKRGLVLNRWHYLLVGLSAIAGGALLHFCVTCLPDLLWNQGLWWYPLFAVTPGVCLALSLLGEVLEKHRVLRWLYRLLEMMGIYSFELYLVHIFLYERVMPHVQPMLPDIPHNLLWSMTVPVIIAGCFLLNRTASAVYFLFTKASKKLAKVL